MGSPWNFVSAQGSQKTRMMRLSDGRKSFRICLAVLIQYRSVTDTQPPSQPPSHVAVAITLNAQASSLKTTENRVSEFGTRADVEFQTVKGQGQTIRNVWSRGLDSPTTCPVSYSLTVHHKKCTITQSNLGNDCEIYTVQTRSSADADKPARRV